MISVLDNAASDFANSTPVDHIGFVPPTDPMNCMVEGFEVVAAAGGFEVVAVGGDDSGLSGPAV